MRGSCNGVWLLPTPFLCLVFLPELVSPSLSPSFVPTVPHFLSRSIHRFQHSDALNTCSAVSVPSLNIGVHLRGSRCPHLGSDSLVLAQGRSLFRHVLYGTHGGKEEGQGEVSADGQTRVRSPVSGRWITVGGKVYNNLLAEGFVFDQLGGGKEENGVSDGAQGASESDSERSPSVKKEEVVVNVVTKEEKVGRNQNEDPAAEKGGKEGRGRRNWGKELGLPAALGIDPSLPRGDGWQSLYMDDHVLFPLSFPLLFPLCSFLTSSSSLFFPLSPPSPTCSFCSSSTPSSSFFFLLLSSSVPSSSLFLICLCAQTCDVSS
eukprot:2386816-Rhodomonas_salina.2